MQSINELKIHAQNMRKNIIKMVATAQSGHPGGSLSGVELLVWLYFNEMNIDKNNVATTDRDRFVLSKGHASPLLYAILAEKGFIPEDELATFRAIDSRLQGHPNMTYIDGVDMTTGSLGQGLSAAVGMALANKIDNNQHRVYAMIGDGESQEGQIWEALMAAPNFKLDNLCVMLDFNGLQIDGDITKVMDPTPFVEKYKAFRWHTIEIDGHDLQQIEKAFAEAKTIKGQPTIIVAHTVKGKGVSYMENEAGWHGSAPNPEQTKQALAEIEGVQ